MVGHKNAAIKTTIPISTQYPWIPLGRFDRDDFRLVRRAGLSSSVASLAERARLVVLLIFLTSLSGRQTEIYLPVIRMGERGSCRAWLWIGRSLSLPVQNILPIAQTPRYLLTAVFAVQKFRLHFPLRKFRNWYLVAATVAGKKLLH